MSQEKTPLCSLFNKYFSPKSYLDNPKKYGHSYGPHYYSLLKSGKTKFRNILEIGVGSVDQMGEWGQLFPGYQPGASLRAWSDFFKSAKVYGIDNRQDVLFSEGRIKCFQADQTSPRELELAIAKIRAGNDLSFDLIVDDGAFDVRAKTIALITLCKYLKEGGLYIIEDVHNLWVGEIGRTGAGMGLSPVFRHFGNFFWDNFIAFRRGSIAG
jgi:hypothetical protein